MASLILIITVYATARLLEMPLKPGYHFIIRGFLALICFTALLIIWMTATDILVADFTHPVLPEFK